MLGLSHLHTATTIFSFLNPCSFRFALTIVNYPVLVAFMSP